MLNTWLSKNDICLLACKDYCNDKNVIKVIKMNKNMNRNNYEILAIINQVLNKSNNSNKCITNKIFWFTLNQKKKKGFRALAVSANPSAGIACNVNKAIHITSRIVLFSGIQPNKNGYCLGGTEKKWMKCSDNEVKIGWVKRKKEAL